MRWAAKERDDVFASVCFYPIIDLEHADMSYEWLFRDTDSRRTGIAEQQRVSAELAAQLPAYLASLNLHNADGTPLTGDNFLDYIKELLIASATRPRMPGLIFLPIWASNSAKREADALLLR